MTGLLDTNVALYLLGGRLAEPLPVGNYGVSVITEMELLSWPSLTSEEERKVREFLGQVVICELTPSIRARAVQLRKEQHLKHAERYRMCDRDGIWGRALDQRHNHRESAGADLSLCQTFGLTWRGYGKVTASQAGRWSDRRKFVLTRRQNHHARRVRYPVVFKNIVDFHSAE